jgi:hypothetical protein
MRTRSLRRLTAVTALALASVATAAACASTPKPGTPGPTVAPTSAAPSTAAATPAAPVVSVEPVHVATTQPNPPIRPAKCLGMVRHVINASDTGPPWKPLCITVGGVLRFEDLGPGSLTTTPSDKVDCFYAAGVFECRLIRTGTARFTVTGGDKPRSVTVTIAKAPANPGADEVCPRLATHTVDASDGAMPWPAICVRLGTMLRIVNFGPDRLAVSPAANVSGWYEGGVRQLTFVKTGTVTFTFTYEGTQTRTLTVVVNR